MSPKVMRKLAKPMLFCAALIWGCAFVVMKNTLEALPTFYLLAIRLLTGGVLLSVFCWKRWKACTSDYLWRGGIMGLFLFLAFSLQTLGLLGTTPSKNAFLTAVYCVVVPFLYWIAAKKRPTVFNITAAALCVIGVGFVSLTDQFTITWGDGLTLICSIFFASHIVATAMVSESRDIYLLTAVQFLVSGLCALICGLIFESFPAQAFTQPKVIMSMVYLSVMATTMGLLFQNVGLIWSDPSSASVILSLESVFGVLCSVLFYGDPVTPRLAVGFLLIFTAVICSETKFGFLRKNSV